MTKDESKVNDAIADMMTLSGRLKIHSQEVECKLCASDLLIASVILKQHAIDMQHKLHNNIELKCGVKFEKCEIDEYIDEKK